MNDAILPAPSDGASESINTAAWRCHDAGLTVLPTMPGEKRPAVSWKSYQDRRPTEEEMTEWFGPRGSEIGYVDGFGLVTGGEYQPIVAFDFDSQGLAVPVFKEQLLRTNQGRALAEKLYVEGTPSNGVHLVFRSERKTLATAKLAMEREYFDKPGEYERYGKTIKVSKRDRAGRNFYDHVLIETREDRGFLKTAPSPGYTRQQGDLASLPLLSEEEHGLLLDIARSMDQRPKAEPQVHQSGIVNPGAVAVEPVGRSAIPWRNRVVADFNERGGEHMMTRLEAHGWRVDHA